jgi:hypothetical protein
MFQVTDGHLVGFYIVVYLVCSNILVESTSSIFWVTHFGLCGCSNNWEQEGTGLALSQWELNSIMDIFKGHNQ